MVILGDAIHPIQRVGIRPAGGAARPFAQEDGILAEAVRIAVDAFGDPEGQGVVLGVCAVGGDLRRVEDLIDGVCFAVLIAAFQQFKGKGLLAWGDVAALLHRLGDRQLHFRCRIGIGKLRFVVIHIISGNMDI